MTVADGMLNSSSAPKVRLVKCPKCRQVLQESVDIPIYKCGGCGVILQAKHRKIDSKITGPDQHQLPHKESNNASEDKDSGKLTRDVPVPSSAENSVELEEARDQKNMSSDSEHFMLKEEMSLCADGDQLGRNNDSNAEDNGERDEESSGIRSSTELKSHENGGSSPNDERNLEREASGTSSPVPHENCAEETKRSDLQANEVITSVKSLGVKRVEKPAEEITPTDAPFSTGACEERFKRTSHRAYDRRMSMETTASTVYVDPASDFSGTLAETPRSSAGNFQRYHRGNLPSYDAPETHSLNRYGKEANSALTQGRLSLEKYRMKYNSEIRYPEMNSGVPLSSSHEGGFIRAGGRIRDRMVEPPARGSEERHWRRPDRGELPPGIPTNCWQLRSYYDYGGPSNQVPVYSRFSSGIRSRNFPANPEQEKMKLLRMVQELEDQLKRTCDLEGLSRERMAPGSHWREKPGDFYYSPDRMEDDCLQMGLPTYSRMDKQNSRWRHHSRYPKRPFSAEIAETSHQPNNYFYHPVDWRRSEPLPPPASARNRKFYDIRNIYSPYSSCPSSPQHYIDYGFSPCGCDTRSDDDVYDKEREYDKYKERKQMANRRVMAAAGGAPWIVCSHCTQLLQLPTDFLLSKKKCHRLRCGSCSTVLKLSLQNRRQLVPYVPYIRHAEAPPPSEADDRGDSLRVNTPPLNSRSNGFVQVEFTSYSDDIGMSCSKEGDPSCLAMLQSVGDPLDELSEPEGLQKSGSSPLHQLMGYSSVSQVFRGPA